MGLELLAAQLRPIQIGVPPGPIIYLKQESNF